MISSDGQLPPQVKAQQLLLSTSFGKEELRLSAVPTLPTAVCAFGKGTSHGFMRDVPGIDTARPAGLRWDP